MSQAKVDKYKAQKANREKNSRKERRARRFEIGIVLVLIIAGIVWFGFAIYTNNKADTYETVQIDTEAIDTYVTEISTMESEAETEEETEADAEEAAEAEAEEATEADAETAAEDAEAEEEAAE